MANDENLQGVSDLIAKLKSLGSMADGKALRKSVRDGMKPVRDAAKLKVPVAEAAHRSFKGDAVQPGYARDHIRLVTRLHPAKNQAWAYVGVSRRAYYVVQFVERGTVRAPAHPWLRPAMFEKQGEIKQAMYDSLNAYIVKVCKQHGISSTV